MKKTSIFAAIAAICMVSLAATSCKKESATVVHEAAIQTLKPMPDESGAVRVRVGDTIAVTGQNLDYVSKVTVGGVDATILSKAIRTMSFIVPDLGFGQLDNPQLAKLAVIDSNKGDTIYRNNFYLTVPVTDAIISGFSPAEGTVGTEIAVKGRNLEQITSITFGATSIPAASFVSQAASEVKFLVPAGTYSAGSSSVLISATWSGGNLSVTGDGQFTMKTPSAKPDKEQESGVNAVLGDEVSFSGENLDLITGAVWGTYDMVVVSQSSTALTLKVPSSIEKADPVVQAKDIVAHWGLPEQSTTIASAFRIDTSPLGPAAPECTAMTAEDGGADNKFFLGKTVTVTGSNLANVEGIKVDGVAATIQAGGTDTEMKFTVPDGMAFTVARQVKVTALYNSGNEVDFGTAMVYPFHYWKDVTIGANDVTNSSIAFFIPDAGGVVSADGWSDKFASATVQSAKNTLNKSVVTTAEDYYSVKPYIFITSGTDFALIGPANSNSQLKNIKKSDGTAITSGSAYGTPIIGYRSLNYTGAPSTETVYADSVINNSITSMALAELVATSGGPKYNLSATENNLFSAGSVMLVQYVTYSCGKLSGLTAAGVRNSGFLYIKAITPEPTSSTSLPKTTTVTMDVYWSQPLND